MFDDKGNTNMEHCRFTKGITTPQSSATGRRFTPEQITKLFLEHPELRLSDDSSNIELATMLMVESEDTDLQEMLTFIVNSNRIAYLNSGDVFWGNYPPKGGVCYPKDFIPLGDMPTGDPIGLVISQLTGNVLLVGPTKSAKTSLLSILLSFPELLKTVRIVAFVKKQELRHLATIPHLYGLITVFKLGELVLCYFEPPPGVPEEAWNNESNRIFAQCYERYSAQRLMGEKVSELMANHPAGTYPTMRQLVNVLDAFKPRFGMREAGYKESILWCLKDLLICTSTGGASIWDHSSSTFLSELHSTPGLCIIEAEALGQEHLSFIATYFMRWLYLKRVYAGEEAI